MGIREWLDRIKDTFDPTAEIGYRDWPPQVRER